MHTCRFYYGYATGHDISPNSATNWTITRLLKVSLSTNTPSQSKITSSVRTCIQVQDQLRISKLHPSRLSESNFLNTPLFLMLICANLIIYYSKFISLPYYIVLGAKVKF